MTTTYIFEYNHTSLLTLCTDDGDGVHPTPIIVAIVESADKLPDGADNVNLFCGLKYKGEFWGNLYKEFRIKADSYEKIAEFVNHDVKTGNVGAWDQAVVDWNEQYGYAPY